MFSQRSQHRKSRGGCLRCKRRKVKCNEARPLCNNCYRHGAVCEYASSPPTNQHMAISDDLSSKPDRLEPPPSLDILASGELDNGCNVFSLEPDARRQLELQLMHHYISTAALTFPSSSIQLARNLWTVDAVRLGFKHEFLLNAILAIATLHLLRGFPNSTRFMDDVQLQAANLTQPGIELDNHRLAEIHSFYLDLAVKQQREAIVTISPENANALVLASVLISYQGLKLLPTEPSALPQPYSPPVQWMRMVRGISDVSGVAGRIGLPEPIIPYMLLTNGDPDFSDHGAFWKPALRKKFNHLVDFNDNEHINADTRDVYEKAVSYIGRLADALNTGQLPRAIFRFVLGFAILTPPLFTTLIEAHEPRALLILAHFFALTKSVDDHWIYAGLADREVVGIRGLLPAHWQHHMEWPLRILTVSSSTLRSNLSLLS